LVAERNLREPERHRPHASGAALWLAVSLLGCGAGLSTSQPAHVAEQGHSQVELGVDLSFSTGTIRKLVRAAQALESASQTRMLTDAERRAILTGAAELSINPPAVIPHMGFAASPWERWELGLRFAASGLRFGARRQLLLQEDSRVDLTVGLGAGLGIFTPPVGDVLESVEVNDFQRWNFDVPVVFGQHASWYRWWAGPRFYFSSVSQRMTLAVPNAPEVSAKVSGQAFYVGGVAGVAFGYQRIFIGPEMAVVGLFGNAQMDALGVRTQTDLSALVLYPAFAVLGEF
jgi:hypothetical protein